MTHQEFDALSLKCQLAVLRERGRFLGGRWEGATAVTLYQLPGWLFVEQFYDTAADCLTRLQSVAAGPPLDQYPGISPLPHWLDKRKK